MADLPAETDALSGSGSRKTVAPLSCSSVIGDGDLDQERTVCARQAKMLKKAIRQTGQTAGLSKAGVVRGVVFDLDGTLVVEQLDYEAIRRELGLAPRSPLLEGIAALP